MFPVADFSSRGGGEGQSFTNFRQICFGFAYFLINMDKQGNDRSVRISLSRGV